MARAIMALWVASPIDRRQAAAIEGGMLVSLTPHPDTPSTAVERIEVEIGRQDDVLWLRFIVIGDVERVCWPVAAARSRAVELWKHTCFEAFVRTTDGYREYNFSPSNAWASYRFDGYRSGMRQANEHASVLRVDSTERAVTLQALFEPPEASVGPLALSAVIEDVDGGISYWALAHPPGKPDFHHPDSFVLELP